MYTSAGSAELKSVNLLLRSDGLGLYRPECLR